MEKVDLLVGCAAEKWPEDFGFSDTAFRIFILMASRRLKSDRFYTSHFTPDVYTPFGIRWIRDNGMSSVLLCHLPELAPRLDGVKNAFFPGTERGNAMLRSPRIPWLADLLFVDRLDSLAELDREDRIDRDLAPTRPLLNRMILRRAACLTLARFSSSRCRGKKRNDPRPRRAAR